jgi:hypothetical protein
MTASIHAQIMICLSGAIGIDFEFRCSVQVDIGVHSHCTTVNYGTTALIHRPSSAIRPTRATSQYISNCTLTNYIVGVSNIGTSYTARQIVNHNRCIQW